MPATLLPLVSADELAAALTTRASSVRIPGSTNLPFFTLRDPATGRSLSEWTADPSLPVEVG